jgi:hypothetical protein
MENSGTPTEATEHVSLSDSGNIMLSAEAMDAMDNATPAEEATTPVATEAKPADATPATPPARTIKYNGSDIEVPADREVEYLQKGYNYEQKMAQLEAERAKIQSYNGLVSAIEASPEIRQKVSQALGYQQPAQPQVPQFDDPIEQLKWETRQEVMREVEERYMKPLQAQNQQNAHAQALNSTRQQVQADPQFKEVQTAIIEQIKALPVSVGKDLYARLDQDPAAYTDMYNTVKARLKINPQQPATIPEPQKRETKTPILESGLNSPAPQDQQKQADHIKALEKRSRAGDFRATGELMALMA